MFYVLESKENIDGLVKERRYLIANALELCLPCTNPSIFTRYFVFSTQALFLPISNRNNNSLGPVSI